MNGIGLVGLGVMGENLAKNIASKGFPVVVYNRTSEKTERLVSSVKGILDIKPSYSLGQLAQMLERPRQIILMVEAGKAVDMVLEQLTPHLSRGDILFDCGNSHYKDTERRQAAMDRHGVVFMGVGVSGGEEGALKGPSVMAGGAAEGFEASKHLWESISAKADGQPCAGYMGRGGAGHLVKMVHNGIEYAVLQLIAETYDILKTGLAKTSDDISRIFKQWRGTELSSFLIEIAADVLAFKDPDTGLPLVELVLDKAGQKGTGRWCVQTAAELGVPTPSIDAAVSARNISALKALRTQLSDVYGNDSKLAGHEDIVERLRQAYWCSMVMSFVQGLNLIQSASQTYGYGTNIDEALRVWRAGCIIRAAVLYNLRDALKTVGDAQYLLKSDKLVEEILSRAEGWRQVIMYAKQADIPTPVLDASYNYFISMTRKRLPANIIQALRDRFGSHTYERLDKPGVFHSSWRP
ncbi:MAG: NADP-dependent phosphogluconate dehydrogenase [Candidatus Caldarchaeum sp.]